MAIEIAKRNKKLKIVLAGKTDKLANLTLYKSQKTLSCRHSHALFG